MFKPIIAFSLLSAMLFSCHTIQQPEQPEKKKFHLPVILQDSSLEKAVLMEAKAVNPTSFRVMGKFRFCDTLKLQNEGPYIDIAPEHSDILHEKSGIGIWDSLNTDGFQIFADYKTSIHYRNSEYELTQVYFPVYLVNETDTTKIFFGKDHHAWGVQEAKDTSDYAHWNNFVSTGHIRICTLQNIHNPL